MRVLVCLIALCCAPFAQAETLADLKRDIELLTTEIDALKQQITVSSANQPTAFTGSLMDRVAGIEAELQSLNNTAEFLDFRLRVLSRNGTAQIADLQIRLCDFDPTCDPSAIVFPVPLDHAVAKPAKTPEPAKQPVLEQAQAALAAGDPAMALDHANLYLQAPHDPQLVAVALQLKGDALFELGDLADAARSYLSAYSADDTNGDVMVKLGRALGQFGKLDEACAILADASTRFDAATTAQANAALDAFACP